jgi:hypothetical protein
MPINWQDLSVALASRLQFEVSCGRGRLISEDLSRIYLAEIVQTQISGSIEPEYNHPDLPGNTRVDLLVRSPNAQNIDVAIEHKWVRPTTDATVRHWMAEILGDLLRVEALDQQMAAGCERALVVSGLVEEMRRGVWESTCRAGAGQPRMNVIDGLLQPRLNGLAPQAAPANIDMNAQHLRFMAKLRIGAPELLTRLPSRYAVQLVGYHRAHSHGAECAVWRISRPVGRRATFNANPPAPAGA